MAWESQAVSTVSLQGSIVVLVDVLQKIDASSADADLNEQSIADNNGGRIIL